MSAGVIVLIVIIALLLIPGSDGYQIMIGANELMIDDCIYRPDCYDKVVEIRSNGIIGTDSLRGIIPFSQLEPIPITPKILEKNGFKKEYERIWVLREKGEQPFVIEYLAGYWCPSYGKEAIAVLKYIHELQHLFKLVHSKNTIEL